MAALRRRLRLCVTAWLLCQAAALSAFVPRDCCATHRPASGAHTCHEQAAAPYCPMRAIDGTPCPMHRAQAHDAERDAARCVLRGTCNAPAAALHALLWTAGILASPTAVAADPVRHSVSVPDPERTSSRLVPPDAPPPRG